MQQGLYGKYIVSKADGTPIDPSADYFVLRLDSDPAAREAALRYADACDNTALAAQLRERVNRCVGGESIDELLFETTQHEATKIRNILMKGGIKSIGLLRYVIQKSPESLMAQRNFGKRSFEVVRRAVAEYDAQHGV